MMQLFIKNALTSGQIFYFHKQKIYNALTESEDVSRYDISFTYII